ncbi:hypothetical protein LIER_43312 [Lithospermum erythrorhizon]|uniref:Uncharacterized protein n=1 Tax=Lithospermum erythrorhizon TaxID=34254 RepID=A0AAV3PYB5_LITER
MFRRRHMNYRSDAYKDYKEYLRRSNPTIPLPDNGSQYLPPSINSKPALRAEEESKHPNKANESKKHSPEKRNKKVEFAEAESIIEIEHNAGSSEQVYEVKSIDMEANDFIKKKHKLFETARLASLKAYS